MKYKYTVLLGILFGVVTNALCNTLILSLFGADGIGVGICIGVALACCGCLLGYAIDKKRNRKDK